MSLVGRANSFPSACSFGGNTDLYGVGVRVGLSAIFFGLILLTDRHEIHAIEPVISTWLTFGALSSLTGSGMNPIGHVSGAYRVVLYVGIAGYACWFWFSGLNGLLSAEDGCTPVAFFGRISIDGWFRTFNKIASVLGLIIGVAFFIWCVTSFGKRSSGAFGAWCVKITSFGRTSSASDRKRRSVQIPFLILSAGIIGLSIAVVEYLLVVNDITGVNQMLSVGQFIPILAGAFGFAAFLWSLVKEGSLLKPRCWIIFGYHLS